MKSPGFPKDFFNRNGTKSPYFKERKPRISLIEMAQSHHISRRKKVKFARFRP
jgi:hypothetical protein